MGRAIVFCIIIVVLALVFFIGSFLSFTKTSTQPTTTNQQEHITYQNASTSDITVESPFPGAVTGKTFSVIGTARGPWYSEATFPVEVLDKNGQSLAKGVARAQGDWMTENFVPYKADFVIPETYIGPATLVLRKDNPSGLPEREASISFPFTIEY